MIILILLNIFFIIYVYVKYYKFPKNIEDKTKEIEAEDSIVIGYINDLNFNNNYDLIDYTSDLLKHDEEGYFDNNLLNINFRRFGTGLTCRKSQSCIDSNVRRVFLPYVYPHAQ